MSIAAAVENDQEVALSMGAQPPQTKRPIKCVLMDDSRFDRRVLVSLAEESRFELEIVETASISETRDVLAQLSADLLVLDARVPDGDGIAFARQLRQEAHHNAIPVIVVSDETSKKSAIQAIRSGAADYLAKDELTVDAFDTAVESALRRTAVLPADQTARLSNLQAENDTLRRIALRNMRLLKAQAMPLMAFAWKMAKSNEIPDEDRDALAKNLSRLTRNMTGLIDDTVITSATHRANEVTVAVNIGKLITALANDETNGLNSSSAHLRVGQLPILTARYSHMAMLFEELLLTAIRSSRLGKVPEIEIGAGVDPDGNPIIWLKEDGLSLSARKQALAGRVQDLVEPPADLSRDENSWSLCQRLVEKNKGRFKIAQDDENASKILIWFPKEMLVDATDLQDASEIA
ncbi:MAG: response regulator [Pseudomonadota bacterium]